MSVHESLLENLKTALAPLRGKQPLETQIETITRAKVSGLLDRVALQNVRLLYDFLLPTLTTPYQVFRQLVRQLLQGKALSPEDMADILSLKDNGPSPEDFATALQILARAQVSS